MLSQPMDFNGKLVKLDHKPKPAVLCQLTAAGHIKSMKEFAECIGKRNETVYIEKIQGLSSILISTSAIAVFDDFDNLS
jgi:hypothetical protein